MASSPDGIMLVQRSRRPRDLHFHYSGSQESYTIDIPIFAICLGHQLMALANGGDTHKLKYGHRGGNHPVKDLSNNRVYISSQNHGYVVDDATWSDEIAYACLC